VTAQAQQHERSELERHGVRATRQRMAVLRALAAEPNDATAQEIYAWLAQRGEAIGLATVYRTLALLSSNGVVDALAHRPGELCYRLCGEGHHHHFVCRECHRVVELDGCDLDDWLKRLAVKHKFAISAHTVEVTGTCADCR